MRTAMTRRIKQLATRREAGQAQAAGKKEDPYQRKVPALPPQIELVHAFKPVEQDEITEMSLLGWRVSLCYLTTV